MFRSIAKVFSMAFLGMVLGMGCSATPTSQSTGEYIDSAAITAKIKTELALADETSALEIEVETFRDVVQLSGFVDSQEEKDAAERIAREVKGVTHVDNSLLVKP